MSDLISRQALMKEFADFVRKSNNSDFAQTPTWNDAVSLVGSMPSVQPEQNNTAEFWRKRADFYSDMCMDLIGEMGKGVKVESVQISENGIAFIKALPSAQSTLYGYNIEHLELIARILQKEDLSPERVGEALTDIGRIVAIVRNEFEEALKKAVEQCMI